jgi:hypothetical protein
MPTDLTAFECLACPLQRWLADVESERDAMDECVCVCCVVELLPDRSDDGDGEANQRTRLDMIDVESLQLGEVNLIVFEMRRVETDVQGAVGKGQVKELAVLDVSDGRLAHQRQATREVNLRLLIYVERTSHTSTSLRRRDKSVATHLARDSSVTRP